MNSIARSCWWNGRDNRWAPSPRPRSTGGEGVNGALTCPGMDIARSSEVIISAGEGTAMDRSSIPDGVKVLSVGELTRSIKGLLEEAFPSVWVAGEVSNFKRAGSGHLYFCLKDAEAQLRSIIWRGVALRLRFDVRDGLEVIARGRLSAYEPRGEYNLVIEEIHPKGVGALDLALRQLREKLFQRGYFDPKRKRPLPRFPRRLALVTSPSGAAVRD